MIQLFIIYYELDGLSHKTSAEALTESEAKDRAAGLYGDAVTNVRPADGEEYVNYVKGQLAQLLQIVHYAKDNVQMIAKDARFIERVLGTNVKFL